jgi:hypothetical protein
MTMLERLALTVRAWRNARRHRLARAKLRRVLRGLM